MPSTLLIHIFQKPDVGIPHQPPRDSCAGGHSSLFPLQPPPPRKRETTHIHKLVQRCLSDVHVDLCVCVCLPAEWHNVVQFIPSSTNLRHSDRRPPPIAPFRRSSDVFSPHSLKGSTKRVADPPDEHPRIDRRLGRRGRAGELPWVIFPLLPWSWVVSKPWASLAASCLEGPESAGMGIKRLVKQMSYSRVEV